MITDKIRDFIYTKQEKEEAKLTNGEVEQKLEEDVVAFYLGYEIKVTRNKHLQHKHPVRLPLREGFQEFTSIEQLTNHIKDYGAPEKKYFFDRNDEEVREAVVEAFKERKCEKLRKQKEEAEQKMKEKQEELKELECEK